MDKILNIKLKKTKRIEKFRFFGGGFKLYLNVTKQWRNIDDIDKSKKNVAKVLN